jgi:N utilization substance protein B
VVIDEAIEIAKKFGAEESPRFVNGVLDGFLKRRVDSG